MPLFHHEKQEFLIALLIGLTSLAIAYSSYLGAVAGGASVEKYSKSNIELNEANATYLESIADQNLTDKERDELYQTYSERWDESKVLIDEADTYNAKGDQYTLVTVLYTIILFLGSMASTSKSTRYRGIYIGSGIALFVIVTLGGLFFI
jgi:hypothetical protein